MELGDKVFVNKEHKTGVIVGKKDDKFVVFVACGYIICKEEELTKVNL